MESFFIEIIINEFDLDQFGKSIADRRPSRHSEGQNQ